MDWLQPASEEDEETLPATNVQSVPPETPHDDPPRSTQPSRIVPSLKLRLVAWQRQVQPLLAVSRRVLAQGRGWSIMIGRRVLAQRRAVFSERGRRIFARQGQGWFVRRRLGWGYRAGIGWLRGQGQAQPLRSRAVIVLLVLGLVGSMVFTVTNAITSLHLFKGRDVVVTPALIVQSQVMPTPVFDPAQDAVLPRHRIVAFYAVPDAEPTGPAYILNADMLAHLRRQGAAYQKLDPQHPVRLGIDLVVSVPDDFPGPAGNYSHHVDTATIQAYIDFCKRYNLLLFLDLNFGQAPVMGEVKFFLPYLKNYDFVHMAVDPEWMFPRRDGVSGVNLSNVRASDLNPIIRAVAEIPMRYHVPRKILIIHQYRPDGDGLKDPFDAAQAEIADKRNLHYDPRVDVVIHIDSVGGYSGDIADKKLQYSQWVQHDMKKYGNFHYGGFKLFYKIEAKTRLMTPAEVLKLGPPPMVITYGN